MDWDRLFGIVNAGVAFSEFSSVSLGTIVDVVTSWTNTANKPIDVNYMEKSCRPKSYDFYYSFPERNEKN
ncbi:MAG: hypothetical protein ABIG84_01755, partial [archaeon]